MLKPVTFHNKKEVNLGIDFSFFDSKDAKLSLNSEYDEPSSAPTKRGRPKKKTLSNGESYVTSDGNDTELQKHQTNEPYIDSYSETNSMLKTSIVQIDILNNGIQQELEVIKNAKTLKNKYSYLAELTGTSSSLLGTKISAIRELNKSITDSHNLDIRRIKELKLSTEDQDDDKRLMDMYNAFVQTPMGNYNPLGPSMVDMTLPIGASVPMVRSDIMPASQEDYGYANYINNMTPEQNRMRYENNPNIKTVVMFNPNNGARWFDNIDVTTGQSIPNLPIPAQMILDELNINPTTGTARNSNINADYPLIVVGDRNVMDY